MKMMASTDLRTIAVAAAAALLAGCSSLMGGTQQHVTLATPDATGASCKLTSPYDRVWYVANTPADLTLPKGFGDLTVLCEKEGFETTSVLVKEHLVWNEIFATAFITGAWGLAADLMSGAVANYPKQISVLMEPTEGGVRDSEMEGGMPKHPPTISSRIDGLIKLSPIPVAAAVAPIRTVPDATGEVVKLVRRGDRLELLEATSSGWLRVAEAGKPIGWLHWTAFPIPRETIRVEAVAASN